MKYRILENDTLVIGGATLKRIQCVAPFFAGGQSIAAGDLGGYVQSENNLSHDGFCWIGQQAKVYGKARVSENAVVIGDSEVSGRAKVGGNAVITGSSKINGSAHVFGDAEVIDSKIGGITALSANVFENINTDSAIAH